MEREAVERIVRMARAYAAEQVPWLAPALYAARLVLTESCPGLAAVDEGMRVYFNPRMVAELVGEGDHWKEAMPELGFVWFHEIAHRLREHSERAREKKAQAKLWNVAGDLEINDAALSGLELPQRFPGPAPRQFGLPEGKLAEFYYDRLQEKSREEREKRKAPSDSTTGGEGELMSGGQGALSEEESESGSSEESELDLSSATGGAADEQASASEQHERESSAGRSKASADDQEATLEQPEGSHSLDEGSGAHGERRSWELPQDDASAPALSEVEQDVIRRSVAEAIVQHKDRGDVPAGWMRWAEQVLAPRVDWREVLKRRMRGAIVRGTGQRVDYSFDRPHRRASAYAPFLPPSLRGDFLPRVACVVDTSGSISERELAQALAEVRAVLESLRTPITVIPCDAVPYEAIEIFTRSDLLSRCRGLPGGGGTDMVAGIEAALSLQPTPDVVLVLTDGYTPYPVQPYRVPVLFGLFVRRSERDVPLPPIPPWRHEDIVFIEMEGGA
ncbi:MAG: VWA-like domain-containing protein [Blastocatellia bacterium]|nr:VWA-like domain-containing protein [Blastocatellia bacterium]